MSGYVADTHAAIWLLFRSPRLSANAPDAFDEARAAGDPVFLPSISLVDLRNLVERGRFAESAFDLLFNAVASPDPILVLAPLNLGVVRAVGQIPRAVVPDMPDRIIAATALHRGLPLISRDRKIQASQITTIW